MAFSQAASRSPSLFGAIAAALGLGAVGQSRQNREVSQPAKNAPQHQKTEEEKPKKDQKTEGTKKGSGPDLPGRPKIPPRFRRPSRSDTDSDDETGEKKVMRFIEFDSNFNVEVLRSNNRRRF